MRFVCVYHRNIKLCDVKLRSSEPTNLTAETGMNFCMFDRNFIVLYGSITSLGVKECNRRKIRNIIFLFSDYRIIVIFHEEGFAVLVNKTEQTMYLYRNISAGSHNHCLHENKKLYPFVKLSYIRQFNVAVKNIKGLLSSCKLSCIFVRF